MSTIEQSLLERKQEFIKSYVLIRAAAVTHSFNPMDSASAAEEFYDEYLK